MFRIEYSADLEHATWLSSAIRGVASLWIEDEGRLYDLELVVAEAANNAAEYSKGNPVVILDKDGASLLIEVQSRGHRIGVDLDRASDCLNFDPEDVASVGESGRGFFLLQSLTEELSVTHREGVNIVRFRFALKAAESQAESGPFSSS